MQLEHDKNRIFNAPSETELSSKASSRSLRPVPSDLSRNIESNRVTPQVSQPFLWDFANGNHVLV